MSPPTGRARGRVHRVVGWLLPGLPAALRGRSGRWGLTVLWLGLLAAGFLARTRIAATLEGGSLDEWIALATLVGALVGCWVAGNRAGSAGREERGGIPWRRFRRHRQAMVGLVLMGILVLGALLTPYLAPYDPNAQPADMVAARYQPPSPQHLMGTDKFGRDVFSRVLYGARISLSIGFLGVAIAVTLGTLVGAAAGYAGGWVDGILMRGVDMLLSFPRIVILIALVAFFTPSLPLLIVVLGLTGWMGTSRIVRGQVLSVRELEYVEAAKALGYRTPRILFRHVLPNVLSPVIVAATLGIGNTILVEAALSFLGLGVQPPTASWGNMVDAGRDALVDAWWIAAFPGLAIVFTVMCFNLVGDGLRDALDPRSVR